jgi:hypothetical protein
LVKQEREGALKSTQYDSWYQMGSRMICTRIEVQDLFTPTPQMAKAMHNKLQPDKRAPAAPAHARACVRACTRRGTCPLVPNVNQVMVTALASGLAPHRSPEWRAPGKSKEKSKEQGARSKGLGSGLSSVLRAPCLPCACACTKRQKAKGSKNGERGQGGGSYNSNRVSGGPASSKLRWQMGGIRLR